jgi:nucleotide-binding universal stress UspA family protein
MYYQHILVPLDGSPFAEAAVPHALSIAESGEGRVELITVYDETPMVGYVEYIASEPDAIRADIERDARAYLQALAARLSARGKLSITLVAGRPASAIALHARESGAGLIVMATHGHGPLSRAWLGSVADQLVRSASVPLLLVRPKDDTAADFDARVAFRQILVPLDGSLHAEEVLDQAVPLGGLFGSEYTLLRAVPLPLQVGTGYTANALTVDHALMQSERVAAEEYLLGVAQRLAKRDLTVRTVLVDGGAAQGILQYAEQHPIDLIAMTTRGRGGFERLFLGNVADKVVRGSDRPLLIRVIRGEE